MDTTFVAIKTLKNSFNKNEKIYIYTILCIIFCLTLFDIIEDIYEGVGISHILSEVFIVFLLVIVSLYLFLTFAKKKEKALNLYQKEIENLTLNSSKLEEKNNVYKKNFIDLISKQLISWGLTNTEQEIAVLLIKGLSINEIAEIRETSSQTIRHQASVIYKKSGLANRSQLSAYFLEDIL